MGALEIKDYVYAAQAEPTTENLRSLWQAVFMLKAWYFIPSRQEQGPAHPLVTIIDGQPWILAFTNIRRLQSFCRTQGLEPDNGEVLLLTLDPLESMQKVREVQHTVGGLIFNIGSDEAFRIPVDALYECARHFGLPL